MNMIRNLINFLIELIFPHRCLGCKKEGELLCQECTTKLPLHNGVICPICHKRIPGSIPQQWKCSKRHRNNYISFLIYVSTYDNALTQQCIRALKYQGITSVISLLETYCIKTLSGYDFSKWIITSVPLHQNKLRARGFNQSEYMAQSISRILNISYVPLLSKIKDTKSQTELTFQDRAQNIQNAFIAKSSLSIKNKMVLIVDDVFTSGATAQECARVLKQNGAKKIDTVVFAK